MSEMNPPVVPTPPPQKSNTGVIIAIVLAVVAVPVLLICVGILAALLLPAVQASREAARRMSCSNNLKQIAMAVHNYSEAYQSLPPPFTTDEQGRPLHSWRTLILPFMEQQALYDAIDLSKPWDDPVNQQAAATVIPAYSCPSSPTATTSQTTYQVVVDPRSVFPGSTPVRFQDITDGTSLTLMVVETPASLAVPWMSPRDCDMQKFLSYPTAHHVGGFNAAFCDGSVQFLSSSTDTSLRQSMVTRAGGETISLQ